MRIVSFLLFITLFISCSNSSEVNHHNKKNDARAHYVNDTILVNEHPDFKNRVEPAAKYLTSKEGIKGENNFYFESLVVDSLGKYNCPWVFWPEKNILILFEPRIETTEPVELFLSRRKLDLIKDVVPTEADLQGSTYLITAQWKDEKLKKCKKGFHLIINF